MTDEPIFDTGLGPLDLYGNADLTAKGVSELRYAGHPEPYYKPGTSSQDHGRGGVKIVQLGGGAVAPQTLVRPSQP